MGKCVLLRIILRLIMHPYAHIFGLYSREEPEQTSQPVVEPVSDLAQAIVVVNEDNDEPLVPTPPSGRPDCEKCGGPNYSLTSPICIACRIEFPRPTH